MKIAVIGLGNMGSAFVAGLSDKKDLEIFGYDPELKKEINQENFHYSKSFDQNLSKCDFILLAIKPQQLSSLEIAQHVNESSVIISILAGSSIKKIKEVFPKNLKIVRAMPNLPASINAGITAYFSDNINQTEDLDVQKILLAVGEVIKLSSEDQIDAVTAVSGSGPGYIYYIMELMIQSAVDLGLSAADAEKLVQSCFYGSSKLKLSSQLSAEELKLSVCSKGGTTEAGIASMQSQNLNILIDQALNAAYQRAKELSIIK